MLRVVGRTGPIPEEALRSAIELGAERTFDQDPKYAIRLLVDIAIRAVSPAVNIPPLQSRRSIKLKTCCSGSAAGGSKSAAIATPQKT
jgi:Predicted membrane protein (DUF2254)